MSTDWPDLTKKEFHELIKIICVICDICVTLNGRLGGAFYSLIPLAFFLVPMRVPWGRKD